MSSEKGVAYKVARNGRLLYTVCAFFLFAVNYNLELLVPGYTNFLTIYLNYLLCLAAMVIAAYFFSFKGAFRGIIAAAFIIFPKLLLSAEEIVSFMPAFWAICGFAAFTLALARVNKEKHKEAVGALQKALDDLKNGAALLNNSVRRYESIFNSSSDAIFIYDTRGKIVEVNDRALTLTGYSREELGQLDIKRVLPVDNLKLSLEHQQVLMEGVETPASYEVELRDKTGKMISVELTTSVIRDETKKYGMQALVRDITKRNEMLNTLNEARTRLNAYLENAPDGILVSDETGAFIWGNKKIAEITGYSSEDLVSRNLFTMNLLPYEDIKQSLKGLGNNGKQELRQEFCLTRQDGREITIDLSTVAINLEGETITVSSVRDISEQKMLRDALERSEAMYRSLVENSQLAIITLDLLGDIQFANETVCRVIGLSREQMTGKSFIYFIHPNDLTMVKAQYER
ncbi:MAG: PAS domain S-box protein, partial [Dehalococcoidales bacterium]|nr:PAS domain S-box protein [Dehalococcoidales bacterium]